MNNLGWHAPYTLAWAGGPYVCWLLMLAIHESGHVLHASMSGGRVRQVVLPWIGFSRTDLADNPAPLFVAVGGALWGSLAPLLLLVLVPPNWRRLCRLAQFFTGFCLIGNGAYLGAGSSTPGSDSAELSQLGAAPLILIVCGLIGSGVGLWLWHWLGRGVA